MEPQDGQRPPGGDEAATARAGDAMGDGGEHPRGSAPPAAPSGREEGAEQDGPAAALRARTLRKTRWRVLPLVCACSYMFFTTRVEVALTASGVMRDLDLSASELGVAISSFFVPYTLFQLPFSVLARRHLGIKRALVAMLVCQGALSMATAASDSLAALIAVRGIMGATMAAFIPTIQSFLAAFFGKAAFSLSFSLSFSLGGALAQIVPVSALLLFLAGRTGWSEWRMFFVLWGVPSLLLAVPIVLLLPDGPRDASLRRFLSEEEHALLVREAEVTEGERQAKSAPAAARGKGGGADRGPSIARLLRDERVLILSVLNLTTAASMGGLNQWQPELLSADGRYSMAVAAVLNAIPAAGALPISILNARHSDATGERVMHSLCGEAVVLFGFLLSTVVLKMSAPPTALTVLMLFFIVAGDQVFFTPFSAYTADILPQALQASGMAIVSIGGSLGNILGPILIGSLLSVSGGFLVPFVALLGLVIVSLALIVALFLCARRRRRTAMALAAADAIELGAKPPGGSAEVQGAAGGGV